MMGPDGTVTRANWRTYPHSVWAFQSIASFLPTRTISRGDRPVRVLETGPDLSTALDWPRFEVETHVDGLMVLHAKRIVHQSYRNGMTATTPHMAFSITKSIVGLTAELLADAGAIDLERPASAYVAELAGTAFGSATLRDLMDQRDGVGFDEDYATPDAGIHLYSAHYWGEAEGGVEAVLPTVGPVVPGRAFLYRTPPADVVGWALRRATGRTLSDLVGDLIWSRIGAEQDAFFALDHDGHEIAGAAFNCCLPDLARLALALGTPGVLPSGVIARLFRGGERAAYDASPYAAERPGWSYRSFWWVQHDAPALNAMGVFGQRLMWRPADDLILVRFGSNPTAANTPNDALHFAALAAVTARLKET